MFDVRCSMFTPRPGTSPAFSLLRCYEHDSIACDEFIKTSPPSDMRAFPMRAEARTPTHEPRPHFSSRNSIAKNARVLRSSSSSLFAGNRRKRKSRRPIDAAPKPSRCSWNREWVWKTQSRRGAEIAGEERSHTHRKMPAVTRPISSSAISAFLRLCVFQKKPVGFNCIVPAQNPNPR